MSTIKVIFASLALLTDLANRRRFLRGLPIAISAQPCPPLEAIRSLTLVINDGQLDVKVLNLCAVDVRRPLVRS